MGPLMMAPKKELGQHFLLDPRLAQKIVRLAGVGPKDQILEIGPGPGVMTEAIAAVASRVIAVEKDRRLVPLLKEKLGHFPHLTILEGDFLEFDLKTLGQLSSASSGPWKVIANLPYNIATEVIFKLLAGSLFSSFYLMVQREVAERLVASPGSRDYGLLSIFTQISSKNRIVLKLQPGAFTPPPKVRSAVVEFLIPPEPRFPIHHLPTFKKVVQAAFSQRRKMISNSLKGCCDLGPEEWRRLLSASEIDPTARAEQVPIERFVDLANRLTLG